MVKSIEDKNLFLFLLSKTLKDVGLCPYFFNNKMKTIKGNLILEKDTIFNEDLTVKGNITGKDGNRYNLTVNGDLNCLNLRCWDLRCENLDCKNLDCWDLRCWDLRGGDLKCWDLDCNDLDCLNLNCGNLNCRDLKCGNLNCRDLIFYAVAIAYNSFKCKSWKASRPNYIIKCLDGEIETK